MSSNSSNNMSSDSSNNMSQRTRSATTRIERDVPNNANREGSFIKFPNAGSGILVAIVMRIAAWTYPNFGVIADLFCAYVCSVMILAVIIYGLVTIASYLWLGININDATKSHRHVHRTTRREEHAPRGEPNIRHNSKVGGGAQFRGRRDLCGAVTMR